MLKYRGTKERGDMARTAALVFLVWSVMLWCWETPHAAESAQSPLSKLVQAAKTEKELTLLGGGGTWGDADAQKALENGFNRKYGRLLREATRYIGISYNEQLLAEKDLPRRLDDLLNPKWKGKIASTPYAASFDRLASVIGLEKTREFLTRFTQNVAGLIRCGE